MTPPKSPQRKTLKMVSKLLSYDNIIAHIFSCLGYFTHGRISLVFALLKSSRPKKLSGFCLIFWDGIIELELFTGRITKHE